MTAPAAAFIQLPDDSGNSGKKIQTQSESVGGNTVHSHYYVSRRSAKVGGIYRAALAQGTITATAMNGTSTGFLWVHIPTAVTTIAARIRRLWVTTQHSSALATPTAPRIVATRFTFTGTASGAQVTPDKVDTTFGAASLDLRTAVTGLTPSLVSALASAAVVGAVTAVGAYAPLDVNLVDPASDEDEWPVLRGGEGYVLYQDVAGTTSDTRKVNINILWDEIDIT